MASFPNPGSVTICEINRDLITADSLTDDQCKETYGKALGAVFSPVPFQSNYRVPSDSTEQQFISDQKGISASLQAFFFGASLANLFVPSHQLHPVVELLTR